jgi:crotonobetainyl-CoA:carnitine CoA-transferase CaiB-like acyl-CoA transferase
VTALNAAQSVTAALLARERGRGGQEIELNMLECGAHFMYPDAHWNHVWKGQERPYPEWAYIAAQGDYATKDGQVAISMTDYKQVMGLLAVCELDEIKAKTTKSNWSKSRKAAMPQFRAKLETMGSQEVFDKCLKEGVPCGKFQSGAEMLLDPQILHNESIVEVDAVGGGVFRAVRPPARFSKTPVPPIRFAPPMGHHTSEVLTGIGMSPEEIDRLHASKVLSGPK